MPEHLHFFTDVTQDNKEISHINVARPTSSLHSPDQSPESSGLLPSNVYHAYDIKNHCAAVGNCYAAFSCQVRGRAAAQLRGNIDYDIYEY